MIAITFAFVVGGRCEYGYALIRNGFLEICSMAVFEPSFSSICHHAVFLLAVRTAVRAPKIFTMFVLSRTFRFGVSDDFLRILLRDRKIEPSFSIICHRVVFLMAICTVGRAPRVFNTFVLSWNPRFGVSGDFLRFFL